MMNTRQGIRLFPTFTLSMFIQTALIPELFTNNCKQYFETFWDSHGLQKNNPYSFTKHTSLVLFSHTFIRDVQISLKQVHLLFKGLKNYGVSYYAMFSMFSYKVAVEFITISVSFCLVSPKNIYSMFRVQYISKKL